MSEHEPFLYAHQVSDALSVIAARMLASAFMNENNFREGTPHVGIALALIEQARGHIQLAQLQGVR